MWALKRHDPLARAPLQVLMDRQHEEVAFTVSGLFSSAVVFPVYGYFQHPNKGLGSVSYPVGGIP